MKCASTWVFAFAALLLITVPFGGHSFEWLFSPMMSDLTTLSKMPTGKDPDVGLNMTTIVEKRGYKILSHSVVTEDGYILGIFNIPIGKQRDTKQKQPQRTAANKETVEPAPSTWKEDKGDDVDREQYPPVILQHGLLDSSYTWVNNFENQSLAFILADAGFDVWCTNSRGNTYSRKHVRFDPDADSAAFWNFTWDDMARYDIPAVIEYVSGYTGSKKVSWVGHSQGTIQMFAAGSDPNITTNMRNALDKLNIFVALAPVAYVSNQGSSEVKVMAELSVPQGIFDKGVYEFMPSSSQLTSIGPAMCRLAQAMCDDFLNTLCGPSVSLNESRIQVYTSQTPAGTSTLNIIKWSQGILSPTFTKYDYGSAAQNEAAYGTATPPVYDLRGLFAQRVRRVALFYGGSDYLADPQDVQRLLSELPAAAVVHTQYQPEYAHLDYTWAENAHEKVYGDVQDLLRKYASAD